MPRLREVQRQQMGESAMQSIAQPDTLEQSEYLASEPEINHTGIKMPEFVTTDSELWYDR